MNGGGQRPTSSADPASGRQFVMNRREYLGAVAGFAVATAGCLHNDDDGIEESDWHTVRGDPARSGITTADAGPGESLSVAWEREDSDLIGELESGEFAFPPAGEFSQPVLYDEYCICLFKYTAFPAESDAVLENAYFIAFSQDDGSIAWKQEHEGGWRHTPSPEIWNGSVYIPSPETTRESYIDVLDADTGEYSGRIELDRQAPRTVIDDGSLYSVNHSGCSAFDLEDKSTAWQQEGTTTDGLPLLMALSSDEMVYTRLDYLAARDRKTGELAWEAEGIPGGLIAVDEDMGYLSSVLWTQEERVLAFDLTDGTVQWEFVPEEYPFGDGSGRIKRFVYGPPVVRDDLVLTVASGERSQSDRVAWYLYALDREDGTEEWSVRLGPVSACNPVIAGETVYAAHKAISMDGEELDSVDTENRVSGYPAVGNGRIYSPGGRYSDHQHLVALE